MDAMVMVCVPGGGCAVWMPWCWRVCRAAGVCAVLCGCHGVGVRARCCVDAMVLVCVVGGGCAGCCVCATVLVCVPGGWCVQIGVWT